MRRREMGDLITFPSPTVLDDFDVLTIATRLQSRRLAGLPPDLSQYEREQLDAWYADVDRRARAKRRGE